MKLLIKIDYTILLIVGLICFASIGYAQSKPTESDNKKAFEYFEYFDAGRKYYNQKEYDSAIKSLTEAIKLDSKKFNGYSLRGRSYFRKKEYKSAVNDLTKAIELDQPDGNKAVDYEYRANAYEAMGKKDLAEADRKKAKELGYGERGSGIGDGGGSGSNVYKSRPQGVFKIDGAGKTASDYYAAARDYYSKKDFEGVIREMTKAIELDPKNTYYQWLRADAYAEQKDYASAIKHYTKIIELNPQYALAYYGRGSVYAEKKEYDAAIRDYTKAIELNPQYATVYYSRAVAYEAMGKKDLAEADRKKAQELGSKQP